MNDETSEIKIPWATLWQNSKFYVIVFAVIYGVYAFISLEALWAFDTSPEYNGIRFTFVFLVGAIYCGKWILESCN